MPPTRKKLTRKWSAEVAKRPGYSPIPKRRKKPAPNGYAVTTDLYGKIPLVFFPTREGALDFCAHGPRDSGVLRIWPVTHRFTFAGRGMRYTVPPREPGADDGDDTPEGVIMDAFGIVRATAASAGDTLGLEEAHSLITAQAKRIGTMIELLNAKTPADAHAAAFDVVMGAVEAGTPVHSEVVDNTDPPPEHINPLCGLHLLDCRRADPHVHCPECGSTNHVAENCDMEG